MTTTKHELFYITQFGSCDVHYWVRKWLTSVIRGLRSYAYQKTCVMVINVWSTRKQGSNRESIKRGGGPARRRRFRRGALLQCIYNPSKSKSALEPALPITHQLSTVEDVVNIFDDRNKLRARDFVNVIPIVHVCLKSLKESLQEA